MSSVVGVCNLEWISLIAHVYLEILDADGNRKSIILKIFIHLLLASAIIRWNSSVAREYVELNGWDSIAISVRPNEKVTLVVAFYMVSE